MKVQIDFSVFTDETGAFGNITGDLSLLTVPVVGDSISFLFPNTGAILDQDLGFNGILKVVDRVFCPCIEGGTITLELNSVSVKTKKDGEKIMRYFESEFGFFSVVY